MTAYEKWMDGGRLQCVNRTNPLPFMSIPPDPMNLDYQEYLEWEKAGGVPTVVDVTPKPPDPPPTVADAKALGDVTTQLNQLMAACRARGIIQ